MDEGRAYVAAQVPLSFQQAHRAPQQGFAFAVLKALAGLTMVLAAGLMILPFMSPLREMLGRYLYLHGALVAAILFWFLFIFIPPPRRASEARRRRFMARTADPAFRAAGLDASGIASTALDQDGRTLRISATDDWLARPHGQRLRDVGHFWWLWASVFTPADGMDGARVRVIDARGREVGGSHPARGSLVWAA